MFLALQEVFILQHAENKWEALSVQSLTEALAYFFILGPGVFFSQGIQSYALYRKQQKLLEPDREPEELAPKPEVSKWRNRLHYVPIVNVFYDFLFDEPPTLEQVKKTLFGFSLVVTLLAMATLPLAQLFSQDDAKLAKAGNWGNAYWEYERPLSQLFARNVCSSQEHLKNQAETCLPCAVPPITYTS